MFTFDQLKQMLADAEAAMQTDMNASNVVKASQLRSLLIHAEQMEMRRSRPNRGR